MTRIKLCGLMRPEDIRTANELKPDYIGFVFAPRSRRYVTPERAAQLKELLDPETAVAGVFVNEAVETVCALWERGVIDIAQLHGSEDEDYIAALRERINAPIIKAFRIETGEDVAAAERSPADHILLDAGSGGTGTVFDWSLLRSIRRPYFLAGGLDPDNVRGAVESLHPYAVDVSSGIETGGVKDPGKMRKFVAAVRGVSGKEE